MGENIRWRIASWLIGHDTTRAIYIGPKAVTVAWPDGAGCAAIVGAEVGLSYEPDGVKTHFATPTTGRRE